MIDKSYRLLQISGLSAAMVIAMPAYATDYNVLTFGNFHGSAADVEGALAAGGNIDIAQVAPSAGGYAVGARLSSADDAADTLVAGGSIHATSGSLAFGNVVAGTTADITPYQFDLNGGTVTTGAQVIDFAATEAAYKSYSATLAGYAANGVATAQWGGLYLTGKSSGLNVFDVTTTDALNNIGLDIPTGATALINWYGTPAAFSNFGIQTDASYADVLFNFVDASALSITGFDFAGSFVAPYADVSFWHGQANGEFVAKSITGGSDPYDNSGQFNLVTPAAVFGMPHVVAYDPHQAPAAVPEPSTWVMMMAGIGVLGAAARRRRAQVTMAYA